MRSLVNMNPLSKSLIYILIIYSLIIVVILIMNHFMEKRRFPYLLIDIACLFVSYMEFNFLAVGMSYTYDGRTALDWQIPFFSKPAIAYIIIEFVIAVIQTFLFIDDYKWRKNHISNVSIKESIDSIPYGICCYYESGMPRLINKEMQNIAIDIFDMAIANAAEFWEKITTSNVTTKAYKLEDSKNPTWIINDEVVWAFRREKINYENGYLYEILATNITEEYHKTRKLMEETKRMKVISEKLKEYSQNVTRITIEKEILDAKVRVHSELGQTLVATRRYLSVKDIDENELLDMWNKNIKLLKKESISVNQNGYEILAVNAEQLGVTINLPDNLPEEENIKEIIITSVNECITNAYKYAVSKSLDIKVEEKGMDLVISITNPGDVATEEIREKGGLKNLRKMIENKGGRMEVTIKPYVGIVITISKES